MQFSIPASFATISRIACLASVIALPCSFLYLAGIHLLSPEGGSMVLVLNGHISFFRGNQVGPFTLEFIHAVHPPELDMKVLLPTKEPVWGTQTWSVPIYFFTVLTGIAPLRRIMAIRRW